MAVDQLPGRVREFADYLDGLLARLDPGGGWCAVFWQRDPDGMRACLDGREVPPWDVVEALLQDLAADHGPEAAGAEKERARSLHTAALHAYDARPGGRDALGDRLDVMLREQKYAAERLAELGRLLASATVPEAADALRLDLAWARDDHARATARCIELRARMTALDHRVPTARNPMIPPLRQGPGGGAVLRVPDRDPVRDPGPTSPAPGPTSPTPSPHDQAPALGPTGPRPAPTPTATSAPAPALTPTPAPAPAPAPEPRRRRRGSARFAGLDADADTGAPVAVPPAPAPVAPVTPAPGATARTPRGARFAGAAEETPVPAEPAAGPADAAARPEVGAVVEALARLRAEGRSGEAHVLLVEAAHWPAARFPLLAAELERAGLGADWVTLLWETAALSADRLVAAADALAAAGRGADGERILRQGVIRPAPEIGRAVLGLVGEGRRREADALLDAYVRVRTPEEAARSAGPDPQTLVPLLLEAAGRVSAERHWDLVHALRVAGLTA
ncbi:hypothetical protein ACWC10_07860 [Streptomyces sp. NPDC001595]